MAVVLVAALCSACTSRGGGHATTTVPGVTSDQIVLGSTLAITGLSANDEDEVAPAAQAVFEWVDDHGGIDGRRIVYRYEDDGGSPKAALTQTTDLVAQPIFADFDPLGTAPQLAVRRLLNDDGVPQLFVGSGCPCFADAAFPWTTGWQTDYVAEGKILGHYVATHFPGEKVAYLYEDDELGIAGARGLDMELPRADVVGREGYRTSELTKAAGLGAEVARAKAAGAQVVVMFTTPVATAEALVAAASAAYHPRWVVSYSGSDVATLHRLFGSFEQPQADTLLLNGVETDSFLPSPADTSNPWVRLFQEIFDQYDSAPAAGFDGYSEYGMAAAFTMVELLAACGPHLTRQSLMATLAARAPAFSAAGLVPLTYSSGDHSGYEGARIGVIQPAGLVESGPVYRTTDSPSSPVTTYNGAAASPPGFNDPRF